MRYNSACMTGGLRTAEPRLYGATDIFKIFLKSISLLSLLLLTLSSSPVRAQQMTADVIGTVTDPAGAVLQGAKVTIRGLATGGVRTTVCDEHGEFGFNLLPIGHYSLKVEAVGFKAHSVSDFEIHVGDRARLNVQMAMGAATETIEVTGEAAALQSENATVSNTLAGSSIQDLPLNGRNFVSMEILTAGVQGETSQGAWSYGAGGRVEDRRTGNTISANGKSDQLNNNEVDGFDNNDRAEGILGLRPSIDGIQEVKVDTSSYAAENGRSAGAVANVITKSGSNSMHGSAYEYIRNDAFDSWEYFVKGAHQLQPTQVSKPELRLNEFGGSIGGPIVKNKTFYFADVEEDRLVQSLIYPVLMPSKQELTVKDDGCYDFSDNQGPADVCPVGFDAQGNQISKNTIAENYYKLFPMSRAVTNPTQDVYFEPNKVQNATTIDARIDHTFTADNLLFGRYAYNPVSTAYPGPFPIVNGLSPNGNLQSAPGNAKSNAQQIQLTYQHIFSSNMIGELKAGYSRINVQAVPPNENLSTPADQQLGFPSGTYNIPGQPSTDGMTGVNLGQSADSAYIGDAPSQPYHNRSNNYQAMATLTYTRGAHNFKLGFSDIFRHIHYEQTGFPMAMFIMIPPLSPFVALLEDQPGVEARMNQLINPMYITSEPSGYVMDDWRVSTKLTLNLGARYEVFTPYREANGLYSNFDLDTLSFICGKINSNCSGTQSATLGVKTDYKDISPRIGFAYSLTPKTVVRGAFGISYFPADVGNVAGGPNLVQMENPPYFANYFSNPPLQCPSFEGTNATCSGGPSPQAVIGLIAPAIYPTATWLTNPQISGVYAKDKNLRSSYIQQYNLSLQRQMGPHSLTLAYVGDIGQQLLRQTNADSPMPVACPAGTTAANAGFTCPSPQYVYGAPTAVFPPPAINTNTQTGWITGITHFYNGASEHYNALQVVYNLQMAKGLLAGANYVWAHALTDATFGRSNNTAGILRTDRQYDYGNADLDVRNRITFHASYNLPVGADLHGLAGAAVKGWQLNALGYYQSGMPFTVYSQATTSNRAAYINLPGSQSDRPNSTGNTKLSKPTTAEWFDTTAFSPQPIGTPGSEGVNQVVGPRDRRVDLSAIKDTTLHENLKLEFRAECFNLTNTENFAAPNLSFSNWNGTAPDVSAGFGKIASTAFSENPRQFQFALKLLF